VGLNSLLGTTLKLRTLLLVIVIAMAAAARVGLAAAGANDSTSSIPPLTGDEVVRRMMQKNAERAEALRGFEGTRSYHLEYKGFLGSREARMTVRVIYRAPDHKEFKIVSQSGSKILIDRVLKRLLDSEQEAVNAENRARIALAPENYSFRLLEYESATERPAYVFQVEPKIKNKFLYSGKIWVDAQDFAVTRIEAEPARNPSFWTKKNEIRHLYKKVEDFWLPQQNYTVTTVRLGGQAILTIDYQDYQILGEQGAQPRERSAKTR
jgi:outer membrane lipoprotein-sorting protein